MLENEKSILIERNGQNMVFVNNVSIKNVLLTIQQIRKQSKILDKLEKEGTIIIVGGMYNVETGEVIFYNENKFH